MLLFIGRYDHTIDQKGRLAVPSRWREMLLGLHEDRLVLTKHRDKDNRCLHIYPLSSWEELYRKFDVQPPLDPRMAALRRAYLSHGQECPIDPQGRILLPPHLRAYAGLEREVKFVGEGRLASLWDRKACEHQDETDEGVFDDAPLLASLK
ncbi:MAG TPA: division/cell wall cluster transcriptional repressor MraZ [Candidatus Limnocylindria bacterium]|nr:division/cell wall cluster transcriptional repressor MraZ [Candidatus Limnocylindria bacterium]